jgi:integrase/recombinase XerC
MTTDKLALRSSSSITTGTRSIVDVFLAGRTARTAEAYKSDLEHFRLFTRQRTVTAAAELLLAGGQGAANELVLAYRSHMHELELAPATANRRLAALRSMVKLARMLGRCSWTLEIPNQKTESYRDTRGPGRDGFNRLVRAADLDKKKPATARDVAILRMLYDLALRRGEVVALDLAHLDLEAKTVSILGKGRSARQSMTLATDTIKALRDWLNFRGLKPGPLFINFCQNSKGTRLTGRSVARVVKKLGDRAGLQARPHGLRHAAITDALDAMGGDVRAVQKFSRHRTLQTITLYDDNREDVAGKISEIIARRSTRGPE